jgi:MFS family permease
MKTRLRLPRNVWAMGLASFLTDVSTDIVYPLLPMFLTTTLGAGVAFVGLIEAVAESTASLLKIVSGWWSDRVAKRKPLVLLGYGLSAATRPVIALAIAPWQVLAARFLDRIGKGVRTSPRDALLADSVLPEQRGAAFALHRAMDNAGAVVGPLVAFVVLAWITRDYRQVFWIATVPTVLAVVVLAIGTRETRPANVATSSDSQSESATLAAAAPFVASCPFRWYLGALFLFTLGNSSDVFLILRATSLGVSDASIPLLWGFLNLMKIVSGLPAGIVSDRIGRKRLIVGGWVLYAVVYAGFGLAGSAWQIWALLAVYGVFYGMTEAAERALVADFYPTEQRGRAYGLYNGAIGLGAFPASLLMGGLWQQFGAGVAFFTGAALAAVAAILLWCCRSIPVKPTLAGVSAGDLLEGRAQS